MNRDIDRIMASYGNASSPLTDKLRSSVPILALMLLTLFLTLATLSIRGSKWALFPDTTYNNYVMFSLSFLCVAAPTYLLSEILPIIKRTITSLVIAGFFLWHGPQGFLVLKERLAKSSDTFSIGKNTLVVLNLQLIKHCLVLNPANYDKGGRAARLMGDVVGPAGILGALDESDHASSFKILNPHTKRLDRLQDFEDMVLEETEVMLKEWQRSMRVKASNLWEVDLYVSLNEVFFKVLYRFMFGMVLTRSKFAQVHHLVSRLERYSAVVGFVPAKLLPLYKKLLCNDVPSLIKALDEVVDEILEQGGENSPLHELQHVSAGVKDAQLRDTVKNLLFAGATTAANSIGWAVHCVSREAKWADRARLAAQAGDVSFFKNVCLEANRMYPQANVVTRRAVSEENVEGYGRIPKGRVLVIPIIALHHLPGYFPNPDMFNPERWEGRAPTTMSYIPFTAGPRQCIGQSLFNRAGPPLVMRLFAAFSFTPLHVNAQPKWPNAVLPPKTGGFKMIIHSPP